MSMQELTLGEICDRGGGIVRTGPFGSQLHESDYSVDGTPVVMPKDIIEGKVSEKTIARVSQEHVSRLDRHKLLPGDIVYGRRGDIGRQALIRDRESGWLCGTGCLRITLGNGPVDPKWLHYYLRDQRVISFIAQQAVGATMPNLNTSILRSIPIRFPELPTQRRVSAILSAYDDLIENNTRRIALLEEIARKVYEEWIVRFRFPSHEQVKMVESDLGLIPEGWRPLQVGECVTVQRGKSYKSTELADEGGFPFVNLKCMERDGGFRKSGLKRFTGSYKDTQKVTNGDLVMAVTDMTQERRIVARCGRVPRLGSDFGVISMDLVKIDADKGVPREFMYGMFRWSGFADEVKQHANGANVLHLSPDRIAEYRFALPSSDITAQFTGFISPILHQCDVLLEKNEVLRATRDLLLPKLISGELDVSSLSELEENLAA